MTEEMHAGSPKRKELMVYSISVWLRFRPACLWSYYSNAKVKSFPVLQKIITFLSPSIFRTCGLEMTVASRVKEICRRQLKVIVYKAYTSLKSTISSKRSQNLVIQPIVK